MNKHLHIVPSKKAPVRKDKDTKKKLEYSQIFMSCLLIFTMVLVSLSYALAFCGKNPVETLSTTIVDKVLSVDFLCFACYALQNSIRAWTLNKYCGGVSQINSAPIVENNDTPTQINNNQGGNIRGT